MIEGEGITVTAIKLRPCPFCGGTGQLVNYPAPSNKTWHFAECSACGNGARWELTVEDAAARWNARVEVDPQHDFTE